MDFLSTARPELYFRYADEPGTEHRAGPPGDANIAFSFSVAGTTLRGDLRGQGKRPVLLERVEFSLKDPRGISFGGNTADHWSVFKHGYQSWSFSSIYESRDLDLPTWLTWKRRMDENPESYFSGAVSLPAMIQKMLGRRGLFQSDGLIVLMQQDRRAILWGVTGPGNQMVRFLVQLNEQGQLVRFSICWDFNGQYFDHHSLTSLTPVEMLQEERHRPVEAPASQSLLLRYAARAGRALRGRTQSAPLSGWCSWYYYYTNINQENILSNLSQVQLRRIPLELFQIDDGYQKAVGNWNPNEKFPEGMAYLARSIKKAGLRAGIWLAPFLAEKKSGLMESAFLLRDEHGHPVRALSNPNWSGNTYILDVTHPEFKSWLVSVIEMMVHDWGFDYLKLDFLYAACFRGKHHDPRTTAASRLRDALKLIRRTGGRQLQLVGCGAPLFPAAGIVDIMRIGMDVYHKWDGMPIGTLLRDRNIPQMKGALINTIQRSFFHRNFWMNDPDCLILRQKESRLSPAQIKLMASVMALSGGLVLTSDDLTQLEEESLKLWERIVELNRKCSAFTPFPLDHGSFPRTLYNPAGFLGVWNPTNRPQRLLFHAPGVVAGARDYWSGALVPWKSDRQVEIHLGAFESFLAVLP
ncbi:MAG: alpha-galactosidase [Spirochaetales bacterium]|nr:alpha-galactosidase [Spirochaetales bacterium]